MSGSERADSGEGSVAESSFAGESAPGIGVSPEAGPNSSSDSGSEETPGPPPASGAAAKPDSGGESVTDPPGDPAPDTALPPVVEEEGASRPAEADPGDALEAVPALSVESAEASGAPTGSAEASPGLEGAGTPPESVAEEEADEAGEAVLPDSLLASVEALLFSHGEPVAVQKLAVALDEPPARIAAALAALEIRWDAPGSGLRLARVAGGLQLTTRAELREVIERLLVPKRDEALTESALDALSVIAYRQPITLPELNELRGVNSQSVVSTLLRRRLIRSRGRKAVVGRPLLYGTTPEFLERFGLDGLDDLPELRELEDPAAAGSGEASVSASRPVAPAEAEPAAAPDPGAGSAQPA